MNTNIFYISELTLYTFRIPFIYPIFIRKHYFKYKEGLLLRIRDSEGNSYWSEISPIPPTKENLKRCVKKIEQVHNNCLGPVSYSELKKKLELPEVKFAFSTILTHSPHEKKENTNIHIHVNALLTGDKETIYKLAREKRKMGYSIMKIKVGEFSFVEAEELLQGIKDIIGEETKVILDMNSKWEVQDTIDLAEQANGLNIIYIEDPVRDIKDFPYYLKNSPIKAGIDEFLESWNAQVDELCQQFHEKLIFIIKPSIFYGTAGWNKIVGNKEYQKVVTSSWESGIGLRNVIRTIIREIPDTLFCGLDTYSFLKYDIAKPALQVSSPKISSEVLWEHFNVNEKHLKEVVSWKG